MPSHRKPIYGGAVQGGKSARHAVRGRAPVKYIYTDAAGMRWRLVGARPVSELADDVMREAGWPVRVNG